MIKEKNFRKCDSVSSASSRRALEHIVPGGHREVQQWDRVRVNILLWLNKDQFGSEELESSVYFLVVCLRSATGRFSCVHSQNDLPIDFGDFKK